MNGTNARVHTTVYNMMVIPKGRLCALAALVTVFAGWKVMAQTPIPPATQDFAMSVAQSDEYEIQAGRDAVAQTHDPRIRAFARQMIEDHSRSSSSLAQAAISSGLAAPVQAMSSDQASMLSALQSLRGGAFDRAYARQQVLAHRQALAVTQSYASAGADANLRKLAQSMTRMIQDHLQTAETIRSEMRGS